MIASVLIIVFSIVLLTYWFRYTCILLLKNRPEYSEEKSTVQGYRSARLDLEKEPKLDALAVALRRDFEMLSYLLEHASGLKLQSLEHRLLIADYRLMQWRYRVTKSLSPSQARRALGEMAAITDFLAVHVSSHSGGHSRRQLERA